MDDDPAEEDDDFEVDLEAVDFVSFALAVVSLAFKALEFESIPAVTVQRFRAIVGLSKKFSLKIGGKSISGVFDTPRLPRLNRSIIITETCSHPLPRRSIPRPEILRKDSVATAPTTPQN